MSLPVPWHLLSSASLQDHQVDDMTTHNTRYKSPALTQKVFENMRRVRTCFSSVETPLFDSMLVPSQPQAEEGVEVDELEKDKNSQALEIQQLKKRVKRLESKKKSKTSGLKRLRRVGATQRGRINPNVAGKGVSAVIAPELVSTTEPTVFDDEDVTMTMAQTLIKLKAAKAIILNEKIAQKFHDEEVRKVAARDEQEKANTLFKQDKDIQKKKRVANETLLQDSFKKLRAAEVSRSESTQEIPIDDPKEITKEDVQSMLEIVLLPEYRVEALQVKYPIIDWEIHTEEKRLPLSKAIMILMLSGKLQVKEDNEMARDLVMKILMEANRPRNRSV
nr:hypothetical protein [Tanacetum cinerariifolium]